MGGLGGLLLGLIMEGISYRGVQSSEKLQGYECGFDSFETQKQKQEIQFYVIGILFLILDIEASFIYPYAISMEKRDLIGLLCMGDFILELGLGLLLVYQIGGLEDQR